MEKLVLKKFLSIYKDPKDTKKRRKLMFIWGLYGLVLSVILISIPYLVQRPISLIGWFFILAVPVSSILVTIITILGPDKWVDLLFEYKKS